MENNGLEYHSGWDCCVPQIFWTYVVFFDPDAFPGVKPSTIADFFDVEKFPTLTFKSTSVKKAKGNTYTIVGDFTMHGVTKAVSLVGTHTGSAKNRAGNDVAGLQITGVVKRSDFGVGQAGPGLSDEVNLIADLEVSKN